MTDTDRLAALLHYLWAEADLERPGGGPNQVGTPGKVRDLFRADDPLSIDIEAAFAGVTLAATPAPLDERSYAGEGWGEERAATPVPLPGHQTPGEYHDYRVTCTKCGEPGFLHVSWRPEKAEEPT